MRAGILNEEQIQARAGGTVKPEDLKESLAWLSGGRVRLVTPAGADGAAGYELAHERLIPALLKLAGKELELSPVERANRLLERKVNEWIGNNGAAHYLLTWRELRLIDRQKPYLAWGSKRNQKEELLRKSRRRLRLRAGLVGLLLVLALGVLAFWESPPGQRYRIKREVIRLSNEIRDPEALRDIAVALAYTKDFDHARESAQGIGDDDDKSAALAAIAEAMGKLGDGEKAAAVLEEARQLALGIGNDKYKSQALVGIAEAAGKLGDGEKAAALLDKLCESALGIGNDEYKSQALVGIAEAAGKLGDGEKAAAVLEEARQSAQGIGDDDLSDVEKSLDETVDKYKSEALVRIAEAAVKLGDGEKAATVLEEARQSAQGIGDDNLRKRQIRFLDILVDEYDKSKALIRIAEVAGKLGDGEKAATLLEKLCESAQGIGNYEYKSQALVGIAEAAGELGDADKAAGLLKKLHDSVQGIEDDRYKFEALAGIAKAAGKLGDGEKAAALLEKLRESAQGIGDDRYKSEVLAGIAEAAVTLGDGEKAAAWLEEAHQSAQGIGNDYNKTPALARIAKAASKLGKWKLGREAAKDIGPNNDEAKAYAAILKIWGEQQYPGLAEKETGKE